MQLRSNKAYKVTYLCVKQRLPKAVDRRAAEDRRGAAVQDRRGGTWEKMSGDAAGSCLLPPYLIALQTWDTALLSLPRGSSLACSSLSAGGLTNPTRGYLAPIWIFPYSCYCSTYILLQQYPPVWLPLSLLFFLHLAPPSHPP